MLKCIQTFLLARIKALQPAAKPVQTNVADAFDNASVVSAAQQQPTRDEESQDSFAELFDADDDFDFEDPLLARLLDGSDAHPAGGDSSAASAAAVQLAASEKSVGIESSVSSLKAPSLLHFFNCCPTSTIRTDGMKPSPLDLW